MPSQFEPCGLSQMMAMRYGTLPIVRETGGLKDSVEPYDEYRDRGTGFSFMRYDAEDMIGIVDYAKRVYHEDRKAWNDNALLQKIMNLQYKFNLRMLHIKKGITGYLEQGIIKKTLRRLLKEIGKKYLEKEIVTRILAICTKYSYKKQYQSSYAFVTDALYTRLPASIFQEYIEIEFEGEAFKVVKDYDLWLRQEYGDYMQLPPIEQRGNQHKIAQFCIPEELLNRLENS